MQDPYITNEKQRLPFPSIDKSLYMDYHLFLQENLDPLFYVF